MPQTQPAPTRSAQDVFKLGAVGVDSSHLPEFTRRIQARQAAGACRCLVTAFWTDGNHDMPASDVEKWVDETRALGAEAHDDLPAMLDQVDGVLVLSVNGALHLQHAAPSLRRGLPTYIDKPLTCDLQEAKKILRMAKEFDAACYSASSLRFASEIKAARESGIGQLAAIDAYGPGEWHPLMPGVFFYGVHTIEMVDALWGPGVAAVSARHTEDRDTVQLRYRDGRDAMLRLERAGSYDFGATLHGREGVHSFRVDFATVYDRLIEGMTDFFDHGKAPVDLDNILENIAVMEAANRSIADDGAWVELD